MASIWCDSGCVGVRLASPGVDVECLAFLLDGIRVVFPFPSLARGCFRGKEERESKKVLACKANLLKQKTGILMNGFDPSFNVAVTVEER